MAEAPRTSMIARSGRPIGGVLAMVVVLGGGMAGLSYRSQLPSFARLDPAASPTMSTSDGSAASDIATAADIATKAHDDLLIAEQGEASSPSQDVATYAAAPEPSPPDNQSAPSIPDAAMPAPAALASRLVPLPVPRPPEFRTGRAASPTPRLAARRAPQVAAAPPEDTRSFFEKLLGLERSDPPRLAYAALETKPVDTVFRRALSVVPNAGTGGVAIYDIRAKVVTLPNGEKLEAHSGLGDSIDDPNHVHVRMKGPTPVGTYDITEREQPFHGVRALRLNPVGGPEAVHGRVGLLAHTYMLGANGASNGCVSFRDYEKFLQAYLRGDVQRLVVVAGG